MIIICPACQSECKTRCIEEAFSWMGCGECDHYEGQYYGYTMEFDTIYFDDYSITNQYDKEKTVIGKVIKSHLTFGFETILTIDLILPADFENFEAYKNAIKLLCVFS